MALVALRPMNSSSSAASPTRWAARTARSSFTRCKSRGPAGPGTVFTVPHAVAWPDSSRSPQPVAARPGSMPRRRWVLDGCRDAFEDVWGDVEVGMDRLDVVLLFQRLQEPED